MSTGMTWLVKGSSMRHIQPDSPCWELPAFPPDRDFVVMVDADGSVLSRWRDPKWSVGPVTLNFGYEPTPRPTLKLTVENGELLKRCIAWFMWGERRSLSPQSLLAYHGYFKRVLSFCSLLEKPILASDLGRFFDTLDGALANAIGPAGARVTLSLMDELWSNRETLGFELLAPAQIGRLRELIPRHETEQTQFIPPRIWAYQVTRMQAFLKDFLAHKAQFRSAYEELTSAYRTNFGSLAAVRSSDDGGRNPCQQNVAVRGCTYLGAFSSVAAKHGIADVMSRWVYGAEVSKDSLPFEAEGVRVLSMYFNAVGLVGMAYLQCFSGMRSAETRSLRSNCLSVENDDTLGPIYILTAETTKTTQDDDARWLTAPTAALAVEAMAAVARWRTDVAKELGDIPLSDEDCRNPYLIQRAYEPWSPGTAKDWGPSRRPQGYDIARWRRFPALFEEESLRITAEDEAYVRRFSSACDISDYREGCIWHFTSHQYRRTAAVMMGASQISLEAQQYQFKHLTRNQSAYYRKGTENLQLNRGFSKELTATRHELVSLELGLLSGPEYVSPISQSRKDDILRFYEASSGDEVERAIRRGLLTVKQTLFGVCTRRTRCPYGGHDNFAHCADCNDALLSRRKRNAVEALGKTIAVRLIDAPMGTPLRKQLERNAKSVERFIDVTTV